MSILWFLLWYLPCIKYFWTAINNILSWQINKIKVSQECNKCNNILYSVKWVTEMMKHLKIMCSNMKNFFNNFLNIISIVFIFKNIICLSYTYYNSPNSETNCILKKHNKPGDIVYTFEHTNFAAILIFVVKCDYNW